MTYRIYGKTVNKWFVEDEKGRKILRQREIEYKTYDSETGELVEIGTEDFSSERYNKELVTKWVYTWDGVKLNKGEKRWFDCRGSVTFNKRNSKEIKKHFEKKHQATVTQLR